MSVQDSSVNLEFSKNLSQEIIVKRRLESQ